MYVCPECYVQNNIIFLSMQNTHLLYVGEMKQLEAEKPIAYKHLASGGFVVHRYQHLEMASVQAYDRHILIKRQ